ncbi:tryptophan synthase subunit alpha [Actinokineospora sp. NBRC 105648]|uniref:tryptophan synthase subunit alpha n=1 Tax=Actinokineospora sp. NBRC 105648 TaxID=3032206 RepID=UPI0024A511CB|nr:tryptophan synthase subunit alpha [Actinokineospora sp. NBRC 105648]GLZ40014.1 tryptophan synthase alpha chain [Actinokineospora sp. NBRC 105648]
MTLETHLRAVREGGRTALVPYVTGGITESWTDLLAAYEAAGADAIEIGLPFSDPMLDGVTIQEASDRSLARGTTVESILSDLAGISVGIPLIAMTYANLALRDGFCARLRAAGVVALVVPDVPLDEVSDLERSAAAAGVELVLLAAPSTPPAKLPEIATRSRGFLYAISRMGTTGEAGELAESATVLADAIRNATDLPVLVGFGVSTPAHAVHAARHADGVVVASTLMRALLDGATPSEVGARVAAMRTALDTMAP